MSLTLRQAPKTGSTRATPGDYFEVAMGILEEGGAGALTIASVCERVEVTKGSFYHHFSGWSDFVDRLLAHWADAQTERVIRLAEAEDDVSSRLDQLVDFASKLPHRAEASLRAWGRSEPQVRRVVAQVDGRRERYLAQVYRALVPKRRAELLAAGAMALLVGTQQLREDPSPAEVRRLMNEFRLLLGE
ncbi:MAG: TetR/AcrR family transcriptional regulator [Myxococcota bacterium]